MRQRALIVGAVTAVAALVAGGLFASNMGFKLNHGLEKTGTAVPVGTSKSGSQWIALPYNQQTNLINAGDLAADISAGLGTPATILTQIARYLRTTDGPDSYLTGGVAAPFALVPGEGYFVQLSTNVATPATIPYIIVGSHNPGLATNLLGPDGGVTSKSGSQWWSYPYHSTASNVGRLAEDINAFAGAGTVTQIAKYLQNTDGPDSYLPPDKGGVAAAWALQPGEAYLIQVGATVNGWVPSHY